jgi:hypothetical protein
MEDKRRQREHRRKIVPAPHPISHGGTRQKPRRQAKESQEQVSSPGNMQQQASSSQTGLETRDLPFWSLSNTESGEPPLKSRDSSTSSGSDASTLSPVRGLIQRGPEASIVRPSVERCRFNDSVLHAPQSPVRQASEGGEGSAVNYMGIRQPKQPSHTLYPPITDELAAFGLADSQRRRPRGYSFVHGEDEVLAVATPPPGLRRQTYTTPPHLGIAVEETRSDLKSPPSSQDNSPLACPAIMLPLTPSAAGSERGRLTPSTSTGSVVWVGNNEADDAATTTVISSLANCSSLKGSFPRSGQAHAKDQPRVSHPPETAVPISSSSGSIRAPANTASSIPSSTITNARTPPGESVNIAPVPTPVSEDAAHIAASRAVARGYQREMGRLAWTSSGT